jgi:hypothetical protein
VPEPRPIEPPRFGRVVARALASPLNLAVAGAGAAAATAFSAWPIAALGGVAYAALVAWDLASPDFWRKVAGAPPALSTPGAVASRAALDPARVRDPGLRDGASAVRRALDELSRVAAQASGDVAVHVAGLGVQVEELGDRAARLVATGEGIAHHLGRDDPNALRREIERLEGRARKASDGPSAEGWRQAAAGRREQLKTLEELGAALERIQASLFRIAAALDGISAKVVRMGAMDAQAMGDLSGDINGEIERLNGEVNTFEEALRDLVAAEVRA